MFVFLDNCRTTKLDEKVLDDMKIYFFEKFQRPDGIYLSAQEVHEEVSQAQEYFAKTINAQPEEIVFTSGATEANNMAIFGVARRLKEKGNHIIVSAIEHGSVMSIAKRLQKEGFEVDFLPVDSKGIIKLDELEKLIKPTTILVSVISVAHFVGSLEPLKEISEILKKSNHKIYFHTDAAERYAKLPIDVEDFGIDLMSVSGHKFHGPKGIGFLYVRKNTPFEPLIFGASSFDKRRPGGENVPGIMGMRKAAEIAFDKMEENIKKFTGLRDYMINRIEKEIPDVTLNGARGEKRTPYNVNFSFKYIEGEAISLALSMEGVEVATGSACASENLQPNYAILAIGGDHARAHGSIRFTFGFNNTKEEIDYTVDKLKEVVERLRSMSPIKSDDDLEKYMGSGEELHKHEEVDSNA
jgi:cysteine desulfurase